MQDHVEHFLHLVKYIFYYLQVVQQLFAVGIQDQIAKDQVRMQKIAHISIFIHEALSVDDCHFSLEWYGEEKLQTCGMQPSRTNY